MKPHFNPDILHLKQSDIRKMTLECNKHPDGINMSQGICDMPLSPVLADMVNQAVKEGNNIYTRYDGIAELRQEIGKKLDSFNNVSYNPDTEIVVTSGTSAAFFLTLFSMKTTDDEIILFEPFYGYHYNTILALGMKPVTVNMDCENNWAIDYEQLKQKITSKTKAIVINTPGNPTGKIFSIDEIKEIGKIAKENNIFIITDEIYEYITYDNIKHISPASVSEIKDSVITIGGFSKTFSITGWRIAYVCGSPEFINKIGILNDLFYICSPSPLQKAVAGGLAHIKPSFYTELKEYYQKNRDLLVDTLLQKNIKVHAPKGAYYLLADFSALGYKNSYEAVSSLLEQTGIATVPGASFYSEGDSSGNNLLRFCFAKEHDVLRTACERLKNFH